MSLTYRIKLSHVDVFSGTVVIGHLEKDVAGADEIWDWQLLLTHAGMQHRGMVHSFEDAKLAIEDAWRAWIAAADLTVRSSDNAAQVG